MHDSGKGTARSLELFTGAGGLALGTHESGFRHVALLEWNEDACDTLRANAAARVIDGIDSWKVLQGDVRNVSFRDFGEVDLVAGGPPCQPFSIGGKHRGMLDNRNMLPEYIRAIRELAPKAFIMENVKGLTRQTFRNYFAYIILQLNYPEFTRKSREPWQRHHARLEALHTKGDVSGTHYKVLFRLLNAANFGVPQTRERVFVVGFRSDVRCEWHFPEATHSLDALLHDQWVSGDYWKRHGVKSPKHPPKKFRARVAKLAKAPPPTLLPWRTIRDVTSDLPEPRADRDASSVLNHRLQLGARAYKGHTGSPIDLPSKTLKAGDHGVPGGENTISYPNGTMRYVTVREAARIQTFPDGWMFSGAWSEAMRQLGNAVPMRLASTVARSVADRLKQTHA